jgi:hypothetical protein
VAGGADRLRAEAFLTEFEPIPDSPAQSSACCSVGPPDLDRLTLVSSHGILLFVMRRVDPESETGAFTPSSTRNFPYGDFGRRRLWIDAIF